SNSLSSHSTFQVVTFSVSPMCIIVYYFLTKHLLPHHQLHCFGESINIVKKIIRLTAAFITKWLTFHSPCFLDPSPCFWPKHSYLILRPTGLVYHETTVRTKRSVGPKRGVMPSPTATWDTMAPDIMKKKPA